MEANSQSYYIGVDIGASRTKVALLDAGRRLIGQAVQKSGMDFAGSAENCLQTAQRQAGLSAANAVLGVGTGYGRKNAAFVQHTKTEIACHARGCYQAFPQALTIIDIGGQDNKVIKIDARGQRLDFKMNRKCAAGTGAFLEEMALRLDIPLENMNELAQASRQAVELGSYCTVFSATEVLAKIRQGCKLPDIVKGLFASVIKRVLEMDALNDAVVLTGGVVAHNPYLAVMLGDAIGRKVLVPQYPQLTGAVGAALFAVELAEKQGG